jgi:hypothetical protein
MAAGLPRFGVLTPTSGSTSGERASQLKPGHFPQPALPPRVEVGAAAADSFLLAVTRCSGLESTVMSAACLAGDGARACRHP